jgi:pimeloyl-ACP methyl ester carboxylesterase
MYVVCCGTGDPVLFIHGMPTSSQLWNKVIARLCSRYRCFAVDLPGMGASPKKAYASGFLKTIAEEIDAIRRQNGIEKWHVVGHDAGSVVAVHYARFFPQQVACMALLAPALFPELRPFYLLEILRKPIIGELLAPVVGFAFWHIAMRRAVPQDDTGCQALGAFYQPFTGIGGPWRFMKLMRWGSPASVLAEVPKFLPSLPMQTLVFHGRDDAAIPEEFSCRAAALLPNARVMTVDSGHFIPLDRPEPVAAGLLNLFGTHTRTGMKDENLVEG